jgi:hypothetical protein
MTKLIRYGHGHAEVRGEGRRGGKWVAALQAQQRV